MFGITPFVVVEGGKTVVAVKVAHGIGHIDEVNGETMVGDGVFGVVRQAEKSVVTGGVGGLHIERVQVFGVGAAIAEVVDVGKNTVLETEVGIVGHAR